MVVKYKYLKYIKLIFLFLLIYIFLKILFNIWTYNFNYLKDTNLEHSEFKKKKNRHYSNNIIINNFSHLINCTIKNNSILIFEPNEYHYECTPGFTKYFIELNYNVDILMHYNGKDAFFRFGNIHNIRLFIYDDIISKIFCM